MKGKIIYRLAFLFVVAACHNKRNHVENGIDSTDSAVNINVSDTTVDIEREKIIHLNMKYYDFDEIDDLVSFFDSVLAEHPIPIWLPEEDTTVESLKSCVAKIEAYRKGKRQYFPDSIVSGCLRSIAFNAAIVNNHGPEYTDMVVGEWFMMCAAYYSPDITCLVEPQTPDHCAGFFNYGTSYNGQPWWAYVFLKRGKGYEVRCLGDNVAVRSIFQLEDKQRRKYYLCSNNDSKLQFSQWLFWVKDANDILKVAECHKAPMDDGEGEEFYFDKKRLIWKYAKWDEAKRQLNAIDEKPVMTLHIDGEKSSFD